MSIGGGVLCGGCVQEEIRFAMCPDLVVTCLFCEIMTDTEAIIVRGHETFSKYSGYAFGLRYHGNFDETGKIPILENYGPNKNLRIISSELAAIDAIDYRGEGAWKQYFPKHYRRDVTKAYVGFCDSEYSMKKNRVATGNWGCGAFLGDKCYKSLVQILAASEAEQTLVYYTFKEAELKHLASIVRKLQEKNVTVGQLWNFLGDYKRHLEENANGGSPKRVFDFLNLKFGH